MLFSCINRNPLYIFLGQELVSGMQFLERCFELSKTCFKNSSKEKVWTKFHMAMKDQDNLRSLDEMVTSAVSPWLSFEALNIMISTVFDKFFKTEIKYTEKGNQSLNDIDIYPYRSLI